MQRLAVYKGRWRLHSDGKLRASGDRGWSTFRCVRPPRRYCSALSRLDGVGGQSCGRAGCDTVPCRLRWSVEAGGVGAGCKSRGATNEQCMCLPPPLGSRRVVGTAAALATQRRRFCHSISRVWRCEAPPALVPSPAKHEATAGCMHRLSSASISISIPNATPPHTAPPASVASRSLV